MKPIAQPNQTQRHHMVQHQLFIILPRRLQLQQQHQPLLQPIRRLQQIIRLKPRVVRPVREPLVHAGDIEIPDRRAAHDVQPQGPEEEEVHGGVELLHEAVLLRALADAAGDCYRADEALHEELAREGEDDGVEGHEGEVFGPLAILCDGADVGG